MTDPVTAKAQRLIEEQMEAVQFDIDANARLTVQSMERHSELMERRRNLVRLYRMHGGDPATVLQERVSG